MSSASGSDQVSLSNSSKDSRSARTSGITTEYISFADLATSSGNALASAHTKENLRRLASASSKHSDLNTPMRIPSTESNNSEAAGPVPAPHLHSSSTARHGRKPGHLTYLPPPNESHSQPTDSRAHGVTTHASSHQGSRPTSLSHGHGPKHHLTHAQPVAQFDRVKVKKENSGKIPLSPQTDMRHLRHSQSSHSTRGANRDGHINSADSPKWETDKGAYGDRHGLAMAGPIAAASWDHMQREVEMLRKTIQEMHKTSKKQAKRIEELRTQAASQHQTIQEKDREALALGQKVSKLETFISTLESAIQCQICMDFPNRPYTLAPCGHVLCLTCLQEWFKTSPGVAEEEDEEENDIAILSREKTCPCCRTVVRHRPCPAFMVKAVASAFLQDKGGHPPPQQDAPDSPDDDPWKGIFPNSDVEGDDDDDDIYSDEADDDDEDARALGWMGRSPSLGYHYDWQSSDSDDGLYSDDGREEEEDEEVRESDSEDDYGLPVAYVLPRWEPPSVRVQPEDYPGADADVLSLIRRGCSLEMTQNFHVRYSHQQGIIVSLRSIDHLYASDDDEEDSGSEDGRGRESMHQIFLGWNITLDPDDVDGETFMHSVLIDVKNRPDRWRLIPRYDGQGSIEVKKLVAASSVDDYSTTETEAWIDMDEHDVD